MIDDAPPLIAVRGNAAVLAMPLVAIVGSRNASAAGVKITERLTRGLCEAGFGTASGLARGIDAAAHRASAATDTVAVLAGGHDRVYPPEHANLLDDILHSGLALTEMPLGWEPRARDFPGRNRLISGLSLGVVIVEAAKRSGSLITARLALEQGREVFAIPAPRLIRAPKAPTASSSKAPRRSRKPMTSLPCCAPIIGTDLAAREEDIEDDENPQAEPAIDERARVVALLSPTPVSLDDLIRLSGVSPRIVRMLLLELEIAGRLKRHGGGLVPII